MWWLGGLLSAQAGTSECEHFGEVSPPEAVLEFGGPATTFEVLDGEQCGGDGCAWRVDGDLGTLSAATGSSIEYTPPGQKVYTNSRTGNLQQGYGNSQAIQWQTL